MENDLIGDNKRAHQVCSDTIKIFAMLLSSNDPKILKHAGLEKVKSGDDACLFYEHFKGTPSPENKQNVSDMLKLLALRSKNNYTKNI